MYVYKIKGEKVTRNDFSRFIAEECEPQVMTLCGFGVDVADYKKGEAITKRMQGQAYRDYKQSISYNFPVDCGYARCIYAGVGCLDVEYHPTRG